MWAPGVGRNEAHDSAGMELDSDSMALEMPNYFFFFLRKRAETMRATVTTPEHRPGGNSVNGATRVATGRGKSLE